MGQIRLDKTKEPEVFRVVNELKDKIIERSKGRNEFTNFQVWFEGKPYTCLILSDKFVRSPKTEKAFTIREFNLQADFGDDQYLTKRCPLEVHFSLTSDKILISGVFLKL